MVEAGTNHFASGPTSAEGERRLLLAVQLRDRTEEEVLVRRGGRESVKVGGAHETQVSTSLLTALGTRACLMM